MRRLWLAIVLVLLSFARADAAIAVVQITSSSGNDVTGTFSMAPSSSNKVIWLASINNETNTISIDGWPNTVTTLVGPLDSPTLTNSWYAFCSTGDGADTTYVGTTSASGSVNIAAVEISGAADCASILDDSEDDDFSTEMNFALSTDITTTQSGDFIFGIIRSSSAADFTATNDDGTIAASDVEIGVDTLAAYRTVAGAGSYDLTFTSAANENAVLGVVALKEAGGAPPPTAVEQRGLLMGVLP